MIYLSPICCVCFESREKLHSLNNINNQQLVLKFKYCTHGIGDVEPDVPLFICNACCSSLNAAYEFKKSCATNIERLRSYLTQLKYNTSNTNTLNPYKAPTETDEIDKNIVMNSSKIFCNHVESSSKHENKLNPDIQMDIARDFSYKSADTESSSTIDPPITTNENLLSEIQCSVASNQSVEDESMGLSEIVKEEHEITLFEPDSNPNKFDQTGNAENNLSCQSITTNTNNLPTISCQKCTNKVGFSQNEEQNSPNILILSAKLQKIAEALGIMAEALNVDSVANDISLNHPELHLQSKSSSKPHVPASSSETVTKSLKRSMSKHSKDDQKTPSTCGVRSKQFSNQKQRKKHSQSRRDQSSNSSDGSVSDAGDSERDADLETDAPRQKQKGVSLVKPSQRLGKRQCCLYCSKAVVKLAKHLIAAHSKEEEVVRFMSLPKKSEERAKLIGSIRNRGNFKHNVNAISNNEGDIIVKRRPTSSARKHTEYLPCTNCFAMYHKKMLLLHVQKCAKMKLDRTRTSKQIHSASAALLLEQTKSLTNPKN